MTNKTFLFLSVFAATAFVTGCSKQVDRSSTEESLAGTWSWISTDGGIANNIHKTPANTGKNIDLKIEADGKYSIYTNDSLSSSGTYVLETRKCIHDHTDKAFINFSFDEDMMVESIDKQNLELSDEAYDGIKSYYKRKSMNGE